VNAFQLAVNNERPRETKRAALARHVGLTHSPAAQTGMADYAFGSNPPYELLCVEKV
jgi:hypothetical protein